MGSPRTIEQAERLQIVRSGKSSSPAFGSAVLEGLESSPKSIPSRFFYDQCGSHLFERITDLPEYYLTRAEHSIFEDHADDIVSFEEPPIALVEFGSGSSKKTRLLIEAALESQTKLNYVSIDIAGEFLEASARSLLHDYAGLCVYAVEAEYFDAVDLIPKLNEPRLFLFLGSNIGNLDDDEAIAFLRKVRGTLQESDRVLIGMDLVKDPSIVEAAYNDSLGVTAEFNKNLLSRINSELGGHFDPEAFRHLAPYQVDEGRVEMLLESLIDQTVAVDKLGTFHFNKGERIHTEYSRKYTPEDAYQLACSSGFCVQKTWRDASGWFSLFLFKPTF